MTGCLTLSLPSVTLKPGLPAILPGEGHSMILEYVHQPVGEEVTALAGYYAISKELRLKHDGREVLCMIGICAVESSCCGRRNFHYAIVPGYLVSWKGKVNDAGLPISEVEPIADTAIKREIAATLEDTEAVMKPNIEFW